MGWRGAPSPIGGAVVVVLVGIWISEGCWGLRLDDLYPFGSSEGDRRVAVDDDSSSPEISLNTSIAFYDQRFSSVYVNLNGFLSFETEIPSYRSNMIIPFGYKIIAPFFADIDIRLSGNVFYRETFDPSLLGKASQDISKAFPTLRFHPKSLFIATWDQVGYFNRQLNPTNTFQLVIASNGRESFALFLYPEDGIGWIRGEGKEAPASHDPDAQAGFDSGNGRRHLTLPGSGNREVRNLPGWNNGGVNGLFLFHIGNTRGQNIQTPSSHPGVSGEGWRSEDEDEERGRTCSDGGQRTCHSQAKCFDYSDGFCCECNAPYIGNGIDCIRPDEPLRISGKVSGTLNGVTFDGFDLHAYVVTSDGRTYTALSRMDDALGQALLSLYSVAGVLGFLFALPQQPTASNGFTVTGYDFNRTSVISYQPGRETVTIRQTVKDTAVPGHLRLETTLQGTIPPIPDNARVEADDYRDEYRRIAPGVLRLSSANTFRVNGSPHRFTVQETIAFRECASRPIAAAAQLVSMKFGVSRNFFVYSESERIVRYSQTNKAYPSGGGEDPCRSATCDARATCIAEEDSYTCVCKSGFEGNGQRCQDVDECHQRTSDCHVDAVCVNTEGSFECRCREGFTGDGRQCTEEEDVQAKSCQRLRNCDDNAECIYDANAQNYICRCNQGYEGDGYSCQSLRRQEDDCTLDVNCDVNANCVYDAVAGRHGCRCGAGYEGNGKSCSPVHRDCRRDVGQCVSNAQCIWDGTEYTCQCDSGFHGDGYRKCTAPSVTSGSYLLYAQGMYVMQTPSLPSPSNPAKQISFIPGQTAIGVDVDCQDRRFYWTDVSSKVINRAPLHNATDHEVIVRGLSSPEGVAVDWISRNLYWTDSGSDRLEVSRLDGTHRRTLFSDGLVNPRGVAVDPVRGFLFWSDWNREAPKIERSKTDGSDRKTIVSEDLSLPNGLTIDLDGQRLCWADAGTKKVECSGYDGSNRRTVSHSAGHAFGLAYDNDLLYWTDWEKPNALSNADSQHPSTTNADLPLPPVANGKMYGIATVKQHCPSGSNPCARNNGNCRFLCLPSRGDRICTCPDDIDPEECNRIALI